jgi:hypothetical protein
MQARAGASEGSASPPPPRVLDEPGDAAVEVGRSVVSSSGRRAAASPATRGASAGCATTRAGRASSSTCASSAGGWDTARGTATPPADQTPHWTATYSQPGRDQKADARLLEVPAVEESLGDRARRRRQVPVGERAVRGDDRRPVAVGSGPVEEGERHAQQGSGHRVGGLGIVLMDPQQIQTRAAASTRAAACRCPRPRVASLSLPRIDET